MTASPKLARPPILGQISKQGILLMSGFGLRLQVQNGHLSAEWGIGEERHKICLPRVNRSLRRVIVLGSDGFTSFDAMRWISDIGASLIFLDRRGKLLFASTPTAPSDVRLRRAQCSALENGTALKISRELISQKLHGQAALVRDMLGNSVAANAILRFKAELAETGNIDAVRLVEAQAAKMYWSQWTDVPIRWPREDEDRVPAHWKRFTSRISPITHSPRLAADPVNACMNLIHALCEAESRIALIATGLDPEIGLLHRDTPHRSSLANDLQETLRPMVDSFVLNWMKTELFRKVDFWEDKDGHCGLVSHLCAKLCETAPIWARAVAPVAEWVAQALWNSSKASTEDRVFPTRLTQRRRSEGRGKEFAIREIPAIKPIKICEVCGAEGVQNRYCKLCAVEVSRETMSNVALIGNAKRRTKRGRTRISRVLSNHAVANSWWSPSSLPEWLNEKCYVDKILPRLRTVKVRQIAEALAVSRPYAAQIRSGRRRPHPRHWLALAKLAGSGTQHSAGLAGLIHVLRDAG